MYLSIYLSLYIYTKHMHTYVWFNYETPCVEHPTTGWLQWHKRSAKSSSPFPGFQRPSASEARSRSLVFTRQQTYKKIMIWWCPEIGVSPKLMVYKGKSQYKMDDLGVPRFFRKPSCGQSMKFADRVPKDTPNGFPHLRYFTLGYLWIDIWLWLPSAFPSKGFPYT